MPLKILFFVLTVTGCTQMCGVNRAELTADQVVEEYLNVALNMKSISQRDELLEFTTGDLKEAIAAASDEAIQKAYVDKRYNLIKYSLIERRDRTPRDTEVTYELTYNEAAIENQATKDQPTVTTENTVAVTKEKGLWYIKNILGNKTSIEFPVTELNTINAKP